MFKILNIIFRDQFGGFVTLGSIVSAVADKTGDDGADAVVKIKRLVNEKGPAFCRLANWPFLRNDITFTLSTTDYKLSGASYLPATFKKVLAAYLLDSNDCRHDLTEVSIQKAHQWYNPSENSGLPDEFCITRLESGFWEIQFNRLPDEAYTFYGDIEKKWSNVSADADETVIDDEHYPTFAHFVSMPRAVQQGDTELLVTLKDDWWDDRFPKRSILGNALASLSSPLRKKSVVPDPNMINPFRTKSSVNDYSPANRSDY